MTVEQLNATPLYSKVTHEGTNAVILKIKNGEAIIYDATSGWLSFYIPAEYLTLVEAYVAPPAVIYGNIATAPLYCNVTADGNKGVIIDKQMTPNSFTGIDYWTVMVWFPDTETMEGFEDNSLKFDDVTNYPYPIPNGKHEPGSINWLLYGAIVIGAYLLLKGQKT